MKTLKTFILILAIGHPLFIHSQIVNAKTSYKKNTFLFKFEINNNDSSSIILESPLYFIPFDTTKKSNVFIDDGILAFEIVRNKTFKLQIEIDLDTSKHKDSMAIIVPILTNNHEKACIYICVLKDGSYKWEYKNTAPQYYEQGNLNGWLRKVYKLKVKF